MAIFSFDDKYAIFGSTPVANDFILEHLPNAKGDHVKVYLYALMCCCHPQVDLSLEKLAHDLGMSEEEVLAAFRHWEFEGLVTRVSSKPPEFRFVNPIQRSLEPAGERPDPAYRAFIESLFECFGNERDLHGKERSKAWEWVEELHLPQEVVLALVRHLIATHGRNFSFASGTAERLASLLASEGASTVEEAADILTRDQRLEDGTRAVLRRLGQGRRAASRDEAALYRKWVLEWQFEPEAILEACAETTKSATPNFGYLDGVLRGLHERGSGATVKDLETDRQQTERVRDMLRALGTNIPVSEGTIAGYRDLAAQYPHELIMLAARQSGRHGSGTLDEAASLLDSWDRRGLRTQEAVEAYLRQIAEQDQLIDALFDVWGTPSRRTNANRKMIQKWTGDWSLSNHFILHCAKFAEAADRNMPYLDRLLASFHEQGIRTEAEADRAHTAFDRQKASAQKPGKTVSAQDYEQRDYSDKAHQPDMPDWLRKSWEEMNRDAK